MKNSVHAHHHFLRPIFPDVHAHHHFWWDFWFDFNFHLGLGRSMRMRKPRRASSDWPQRAGRKVTFTRVQNQLKSIGKTVFCAQRQTHSPNPYKTCRLWSIPGAFLRKGAEKSKKSIRIFTVSSCLFTYCKKHVNPLGKRCFAEARNGIQETL